MAQGRGGIGPPVHQFGATVNSATRFADASLANPLLVKHAVSPNVIHLELREERAAQTRPVQAGETLALRWRRFGVEYSGLIISVKSKMAR